MIVLVQREGVLVGTYRIAFHITPEGSIPLNCWFCSSCCRIWAREDHLLEEHEPEQCPPLYFLVRRPCSAPIFYAEEEHPTLWECADKSLLENALKERSYDRNQCTLFPRGEIGSNTFPKNYDRSRALRIAGTTAEEFHSWRASRYHDASAA